MANLPPQIKTYHTSLPPPFPGAPGFTFHLTRLKDTLMIWVGGQTLDEDEARTRLAAEWAVAMPGRGRFNPNQVHLSMSLPASLTTTSKQTMDPYASKAVLVMEKKLGAWIDDILEKEKQA
ncbi:hypothetical protein A1Q2_00025 [Trichosporon asahii var. asahii CBS 8904]|uniref:Uncharacterized protein n=1 Tax=Trichosporon asahii var. asahii (strain CBS 8904) TaxID=1220162 RepID=K1WA88_TRIAC|nr:hypothetical protein A1Q2_00025 [Trichosporon asahii var. asahii CBS 8904]